MMHMEDTQDNDMSGHVAQNKLGHPYKGVIFCIIRAENGLKLQQLVP